MKPRTTILGLVLTLVWYFFIIFITNKYLKGFNNIIYFVIVLILLYVGGEIISHFTPSKNNK
ncbi:MULTISPECIES: hypothetical protein [Clostridium]|uniref:Uncharacterized protein n=1 Tax=Clostridium frigoriphilum TaxID=443253 RepID=A0ABU7UYD4_9CLOT|nr:hypothetical protein [Clostridium sp. DSM 17811]MBU3102421.1 hypothetical protein [Clostridium sp. DSM 17811]